MADGILKLDYYIFPPMLVIPPKSQKVMKLDISKLVNMISPGIWNDWSYLRFAKKTELDSIVSVNYNDRINEYTNSLISIDTVSIYCYDINTIDSVYKFAGCNRVIHHIQDAFRIGH
jgi:hypothetical protein